MSIEVKAAISNKERQQLESLYTFREPETVVQYLEENPYLVPLLLEAPAHIHTVFPGAPLYLEVLTDPEEGYTILWASYGVREYEAEEIINKEEQFDYNWSLNALHSLPIEQNWRLNFCPDFA